MYNPIVSIRNAETRASDPEAALGPYRPIRAGETVDKKDVMVGGVPERIYGGRRCRGPLPEGVPADRRQPQSTVHNPQPRRN